MEEALSAIKDMHLTPIRIRELTKAKHIFSHIEWQMEGYAILVEEAERVCDETGLIFVEAETSEQKFALPAAFAAYARYMNIRIGNGKFSENIS